jgi:hypothetical protein
LEYANKKMEEAEAKKYHYKFTLKANGISENFKKDSSGSARPMPYLP